MVDGGEDLGAVLGDALLELDERCDPAAPCPRDPSVQRLGGLVCWELEDGTQAFFEQIGAVEPRMVKSRGVVYEVDPSVGSVVRL